MRTPMKSDRSFLLAGALLTIGLLLTSTDTVAAVWNVSTVQNLQIALTTSQNNGEDDTINVAAGFYDVSAAALRFEPVENFSLTIEGDGANTTTLDGGLSSAILTVTNLTNNNAHVTIKDIAFWRGHNSVNARLSGLAVNTVAQITIEKLSVHAKCRQRHRHYCYQWRSGVADKQYHQRQQCTRAYGDSDNQRCRGSKSSTTLSLATVQADIILARSF